MRHKLIKRFFNYLAIPSQSDAKTTTLPSSQGQYELAKLLEQELLELELENVLLQDNAILTAKLKGNTPNIKSIGFCAHLDTVDVGLSPVIKPQILKYTGTPLLLNQDQQIWIDPQTHPELNLYLNEEIIFSDGTSILGADNKSAISIIMCLLESLISSNEPRGDVYVCFLPDEEIGLRGAKALDLKDFPADYAYTIDCCQKGELVYETFNAGSAIIEIKGISAHPMNAKGILVNPTLIAVDIANCLDRLQTPENTQSNEGYIWLNEIHSDQNNASMLLQIRDHHKTLYEEKKLYLQEVVSLIQKRYPKASIQLKLEDIYHNIKDSMTSDEALKLLKEAFKNAQVEEKVICMRGGTDGSALSAKGLFVPNFFTGAHNFHSRFEFLPISSFEASFEVARQIVHLAANSFPKNP
ncbi:peptidase T [Helicobacter kayseriensis]|uniref:peptidase T n=1 Tax=Helicobacter kayseriensis TaxID=2905877 RepID=UPI001E5E5972|nr:peptidase T [Helicobacter kayseriensis]MCE3047008.1 peptidase T [Helicobacter kayseriensis]MCE3048332.1 peptidase T [Helicobacter kayseriensis]